MEGDPIRIAVGRRDRPPRLRCQLPILVNVTLGRPCHPQTAREPGTTLEHMDFSRCSPSVPTSPERCASASSRIPCALSWKRIEYFPDTDSLYIDLAERAGVDTREIGDGIVVDVDADGHPVGIDIDQASKHLDLRTLDLRRIPFGVEKLAG